jgi:hypothetical protein
MIPMPKLEKLDLSMKLSRICTALVGLLIFCANARAAESSSNYEQLIAEARRLMKEEKLVEAEAKAKEAAAQDGKRYDAHAVGVLIALRRDDLKTARQELQQALELAPPEKRASLEVMQKQLTGVQTSPATFSGAAALPSPLSGDARRKLDVLELIIGDADNAKSVDERNELLGEFLEKSEAFLVDHPNETGLWLVRAIAAIELGRPKIGWQAGVRLKALDANSSDLQTRIVMAQLERRRWLVENESEIERVQAVADSIQRTMQAIRDATVVARRYIEELQAAANDPDIAKSVGLWKTFAALNRANLDRLQASLSSGDVSQLNLQDCALPPSAPDKYGNFCFYSRPGMHEAIWGTMYEEGDGVAKNEAEAVNWYRKSSALGYEYGQFALGQMYAEGRGVAKDEAEALNWYRKAAHQGNESAKKILIEKDPAAAAFEKAEVTKKEAAVEGARRSRQAVLDRLLNSWLGDWKIISTDRFRQDSETYRTEVKKGRWKGRLSIAQGNNSRILVTADFDFTTKSGSERIQVHGSIPDGSTPESWAPINREDLNVSLGISDYLALVRNSRSLTALTVAGNQRADEGSAGLYFTLTGVFSLKDLEGLKKTYHSMLLHDHSKGKILAILDERGNKTWAFLLEKSEY